MSFDNTLTDARGASGTDKTIYQPIQFEIISISNPTVTVKNADQGSSFIYNETLALGGSTKAKRLEFNDPMAQMFSFDAKIYGNAFAGSTTGDGEQNDDGTGDPPPPVVNSIFREVINGTLVAGEPTATSGTSATWGDPAFKGITWEDFEVTTKSDADALEATLSSLTAVDLDFEMRTADGQILSSSGNIDANEFVSSAVQPNTKYILRVMGFTNGPAEFTIVSDQLLPEGSPNENAGTRTSGGNSLGGGSNGLLPNIIRFNVNPITKQITANILK